jgi:hypothetical protein
MMNSVAIMIPRFFLSMEYTSYLFSKHELDPRAHGFRPGYLRILSSIINEFCDNLLNVCEDRVLQKRKLRDPVPPFLAGIFAVPLGIFLLGRAEITLAFIGAAVLFLPLFVFLKVIRPEGGGECISILRVPAEADPAGDEDGRGCDHRSVLE